MQQTYDRLATIPGTVYLVGAGPGDPGLITVRGRDLLRAAGAVVYDALANPALLDEAPPWAERIFAGKRAGRHTMSQDEINDTLCAKAYAHAVVVRLKGGDPFVFGRGSEEMAYLRAAGIPVEVVPGVSSAIAAPAAAGVPVTQRGLSNSFAVVTGHRTGDAAQEPAWDALARIDTVVVLMGLKQIGHVVKRLLEAGRAPDTPAMVVCAATLPGQQSAAATLGTLEEAAVGLPHDAPATLVVGAVVGVADCGDAVDLQPAALRPRVVGFQFAA